MSVIFIYPPPGGSTPVKLGEVVCPDLPAVRLYVTDSEPEARRWEAALRAGQLPTERNP